MLWEVVCRGKNDLPPPTIRGIQKHFAHTNRPTNDISGSLRNFCHFCFYFFGGRRDDLGRVRRHQGHSISRIELVIRPSRGSFLPVLDRRCTDCRAINMLFESYIKLKEYRECLSESFVLSTAYSIA